MTLTTFPFDPLLDLPAWRGQRVERYRFELRDGVTGAHKAWLQPSRSPAPQLSHDTSRRIKRQLSLQLHRADTQQVDPLRDRVLPYLVLAGGISYPLGRYLFTDDSRSLNTGGDRGVFTLLDEGFILDQQLERGFSSSKAVSGAVLDLLLQVPFNQTDIEPTVFRAVGAFQLGTNRGQILDTYTTQGDYLPHWLDHAGTFRLVRTRDPAAEVPDLDWDTHQVVRVNSLTLISDVLNAPNRFIVTSNSGQANTPLVGTYDVPPTAPHSISQRGFVLPQVQTLQLSSAAQAQAAARNLGLRQTVFERLSVETAADPRHDGWNVIRFLGVNWLELSWSMTLLPGAPMQHELRKGYA